MKTQIVVQLKDGRRLPVKDFDNTIVFVKVNRDVLAVPMKDVKSFICFGDKKIVRE